jgi:hypothetical protein
MFIKNVNLIKIVHNYQIDHKTHYKDNKMVIFIVKLKQNQIRQLKNMIKVK